MGKAKMEQEHQPNDKEARTESTDEPMMENENDEEQASSKLSELYVSDDMAAFCEVGSLREALNLTVVLEKEHQGKIAEGGAGVLERADPLVDDVVVRLVALSTNGTTKR